MLTNKWIITDKQSGNSAHVYKYTLVFVGTPNYPQTYIINTALDMQIGTLVKIDSVTITPLENLYNAKQTKIAKVKLLSCHDFYGSKAIKISLFGVNYGIFDGIIPNPQSNRKLTRGDVVKVAIWKNPDYTIEMHIIENLTTKQPYIYDQRATKTQEMVVLDADMAGAFDGQSSYKHLLVNSHSGCYSMVIPSTDYLFSIHEQDELLVLDDPKHNWFEILDNKTINEVMSRYIRQK